ncbi:MAG: hypothetical protein IH948_03915, partial [Bacteroidetes bacterium]|nr:hypothetical protein [Bacteroidota bacterium]
MNKGVFMEKRKAMSPRRKILAEAIRETQKLMGINLDALSAIQDKFQKKYDEILPEIEKEQVIIAQENAKFHKLALQRRYTEAKRLSNINEFLMSGDFTKVQWIPFPWCWCNFIRDFKTANACNREVTEEDVDIPGKFVAESGCVTEPENKHKPYVSLRGSGDTTWNRGTQKSWFIFNMDDDNFSSSGKYCITPTV